MLIYKAVFAAFYYFYAMELTTNNAWNNFSSHVFNFIGTKVKVEEDAEDIMQDVFVRIHLSIGKLKEEDKLQAWIFRIARNAIIDYWKKRNKELEAHGQFPESNEDEELLEHELRDCLLPMINDLPEKYREAIILSELEELKQKEVAEKLGISLSGAKSRVQRGREMLKQSFIDCCNFQLNGKGQVKAGYNEKQCYNC